VVAGGAGAGSGAASAGATAGATGAGGGGGGALKKKGKEQGVSADQISAFPTKKSPVYKVRFTNMNLVVAGAAYLP
jgi:transcription initiation factor TFIID subunit 5